MRLFHTMIRVGELERSIRFYTRVLGMTVLRREEYPAGRFTLAFVGYGPEHECAVLELTHNWDTSPVTILEMDTAISRLKWMMRIPPAKTSGKRGERCCARQGR